MPASNSIAWVDQLPVEAQDNLLARVRRQLARGRIGDFYPDAGPLRREVYPKHQAFLAAGVTERVRMMMAANRVGKTEAVGGYEAVLHMTREYPSWWLGRRFDRPVKGWLCGDTSKTVREILQFKVLGPWSEFGTGLVPADTLEDYKTKQGVAETIDTFSVKHKSGGLSRAVFKSYDQGREAFQGSEQDFILLDEEPPLDIFSECVMRTMTNNGLVMLTFTPLGGITALIRHLREVNTWEIGATWDDAPHLTQEAKEDLWRNTPAYMRDARSKGIPQRGSGVVFPINEETIKIPRPEIIPKSWKHIIGIDFGWDHPTAAVKLLHNCDDDIIIVAGAIRMREATPLMFAANIRHWGRWPPVAWPHDGLHHKDPRGGMTTKDLYAAEGMNMLDSPASFSDDKLEHSVETGIMEMLDYMQSGRFFVIDTLEDWLFEFRDYYRKEGIIVKERDDLMDATRYAFMMRRFAIKKPARFASQPGERQPVNWRTL